MLDMKLKAVKTQEKPWPEFPIPQEWIQEGKPDSRAVYETYEVDGGPVICGRWECTPSKFRWEYEVDEFVLFEAGEVVITEDQGESHTYHAGDMVHFPRGLVVTWDIKKTVQKVFFQTNFGNAS